MKQILYVALILFLILHNDLWYWNDARLVAGLPAGLLYHIVYCIAASLLMYLLVQFAWPPQLDSETSSEEKRA